MAVAIVWSSPRASRPCSDGSFCRAARPRTPGRGIWAITPAVGHAVGDRLGPAVPGGARRCPGVPGGEPRRGRDTGRCPADDPPPLLALRVAGGGRMVGRRVISRSQFCPQPVTDAEQGLLGEVRKVMDDMNGPGRVTP